MQQPDYYTGCRAASVYQLDLTTPGISPLSASDRKHRRQMPNLRRNARGRPQSWQRLCWRELNFGLRASFTRFAVVAIFPLRPYLRALAEGHPELLEQRASRIIVLGRGHDGDVHALQLFNLGVIDLRE